MATAANMGAWPNPVSLSVSNWTTGDNCAANGAGLTCTPPKAGAHCEQFPLNLRIDARVENEPRGGDEYR